MQKLRRTPEFKEQALSKARQRGLRTLEVAERFNSLPSDAVRETKKLMRGYDSVEVSKAIALEGRILAERLDSQDAKEAFSAFLQKRKPNRTLS